MLRYRLCWIPALVMQYAGRKARLTVARSRVKQFEQRGRTRTSKCRIPCSWTRHGTTALAYTHPWYHCNLNTIGLVPPFNVAWPQVTTGNGQHMLPEGDCYALEFWPPMAEASAAERRVDVVACLREREKRCFGQRRFRDPHMSLWLRSRR